MVHSYDVLIEDITQAVKMSHFVRSAASVLRWRLREFKAVGEIISDVDYTNRACLLQIVFESEDDYANFTTTAGCNIILAADVKLMALKYNDCTRTNIT